MTECSRYLRVWKKAFFMNNGIYWFAYFYLSCGTDQLVIENQNRILEQQAASVLTIVSIITVYYYMIFIYFRIMADPWILNWKAVRSTE